VDAADFRGGNVHVPGLVLFEVGANGGSIAHVEIGARRTQQLRITGTAQMPRNCGADHAAGAGD
jgi:hypothetical protein